VNPISATFTGRLGADPYLGETKAGKPLVALRLAVDVPPRTSQGETRTRWYKVMAFGTLATYTAQSLHKGDRVVVRADDITTDIWSTDDGTPRAATVVWAHDIGLSLVFDTAVSGYATRKAAGANSDVPPQAPTPAAEQATTSEVLAGVLRENT